VKNKTIWSINSIILIAFMWKAMACAAPPYEDYLTTINPAFMITPDQGYEWHVFKDEGGPTYAGSPSWKRFVEFIESQLREYGVVDMVRNTWTYDRYHVNDWPVHEGPMELVSDGTPVPVASFGMCSGSTGPEGITAQMVFYDPASPPTSIEGKIVVVKTAPHPDPPYNQRYIDSYTVTDHEYRSDTETFPPMFQYVPPSVNNSFNTRWNWGQLRTFRDIAVNGRAAGMVVVYDLPPETAKGLYQRTTEYSCPTLTLDRVNGSKVVEDAQNGKTATLTLLADYIPSEPYNFIGYLPGKDYGTEEDEMVALAVHTDAMALTQDNGALGLLGIVHYFSQIPQSERPRTLLLYVDCRHFMPGGERAWEDQDLLNIHTELLEPIVATIGLEHMGELEAIEVGDELKLSGMVEYSYIGVDNNALLVEMAIKAKWPSKRRKTTIGPDATLSVPTDRVFMADTK
jgi:hypothetical protein